MTQQPPKEKLPYTALAAPQYNRHRKRLSPAVKKVLNDVQAVILKDPRRGDPKGGALKGVYVEKFPAENDQWLVAYEIDEKRDAVTFLAVGQHENFYRDLIRYRRETGAAR